MKKTLFSLALFMSVLHLFGQTDLPTYGYNYQAIIRNASGNIVANAGVQLRFQILNSADHVQYEETQAPSTDQFGKVAVVVGAGMATLGLFDTLDWAARKHFLGVAVKLGGVQDWVESGKKEIVQLPFVERNNDWQVSGQNIFRLNGKVGIGTSNPANKFDVRGEIRSSGDWGSFAFRTNSGKEIYSQITPSGKLYFWHWFLNKEIMVFDEVGRVGIKTNSPLADLDVAGSIKSNYLEVNGDALVKVLHILGNDRAERFLTTTHQPLPAGTVAVFDETQPGKIRPCTKAYDRKRTGIVSDLSGTGKYRPGIIHEQENTKGGSPVALDGRVEVLAVGPIAVGDYLTTSHVPSHAMKAKNRRKSYGAVLGQAITPLAKGERGKVEMMVERR